MARDLVVTPSENALLGLLGVMLKIMKQDKNITFHSHLLLPCQQKQILANKNKFFGFKFHGGERM